MTLDEAVEFILDLRDRLPRLVGEAWPDIGPEVTELLDRLRASTSAFEREELIDQLLTLLAPYDDAARELAPVASVPISEVRTESGRRRGGTNGAERGPVDHVDVDDLPRDGGEREPPAVIERTPHLDIDANEPIGIGDTFSVTVYLDTEDLSAGESGAKITLPYLPMLELNVWLITSDHFEVTGEVTASVTVYSDADRSTEATFTLECVGAADGAAGITAMFAYNGRPAGQVTRGIRVEGVRENSSTSIPAPALRVDADAREADLVVQVVPDPDGDEQHYVVTVSSPWLDELERGITARWRLPSATKQFVAGFMNAFTTGAPGGPKAALVGAGKGLFRATPKIFRDAFWALVDSGEPLETLYVVTSEPYIPWELMIPVRDGQARQPLGVELSVGRWVHEQHTSPTPQAVSIEDSYVVAPTYRSRALSFSDAEAKYVMETFNGQRISPAFLRTIDATLGGRGATLLHFICHGLDDPGGQLLELDPDDRLLDFQLEGLDGVIRAVGDKQPLVFINACEVGRTTPALVGTGGFAAAFTRLGARCVIAPIWSVKDSVAEVVARRFYTEIAADPSKPFATAIRDLRKLAYEGDDPEDSYAAYCFYGDPRAAQIPV